MKNFILFMKIVFIFGVSVLFYSIKNAKDDSLWLVIVSGVFLVVWSLEWLDGRKHIKEEIEKEILAEKLKAANLYIKKE